MLPLSPQTEEYEAFELVLKRHMQGSSESDIRIAFISFLEKAGIASLSEMSTEDPPGPISRDRMDLYLHNTCIEFKKDITHLGKVNAEDIAQLDGYIKQLVQAGAGVQNGILTDGVHYQIRRIGDDTLPLTQDSVHVFDQPQQAPRLREYLHRVISAPASDIAPTDENLTRYFGIDSDVFRTANTLLTDAHNANRDNPTVAVKRKLWQELLQVALGQDSLKDDASNDWLYIRHTYLTTLVSLIVQAHFGIDVVKCAEDNPTELLNGSELYRHTNLKGIIDSDLFGWPLEVKQSEYVKVIARKVAQFDWAVQADELAATLYQNTITQEERKRMGEYYTPRWLAHAIVSEVIPEPHTTTVLDPACGSGTFLEAAIRHLLDKVPSETSGEAKLELLQSNIAGIDLHPVAVQLAKATWVMNAREAIAEARGENPNLPDITAPVHLGDSMQLRYDNSRITGQGQITLNAREKIPGHQGEVVFEVPMSLARDVDRFDNLMIEIADAIERGADTDIALDRHGLTEDERRAMETTISSMRRLHEVGRNHVWAYYLRNMTRPAVIAEGKVDAIVGNPPWLTYRQSADIIRDELRGMSEVRYSIWAGGNQAPHQDIADLFYCRSAELYLKEDGVIGMVMPHSALRTGQHLKFRKGVYVETAKVGRGRARRQRQSMGLDFSLKTPWDLQNLVPNDFFPMLASVIFARMSAQYGSRDIAKIDTKPLAPGTVEMWSGPTGTKKVKRTAVKLHHDDGEFHSPYASLSNQGPTITDRRLFFITTEPNKSMFPSPGTFITYPQPGSQDKKKYNIDALKGHVVHEDNLFDVYLGESLAPFVALPPRKAALPIDRQTMTMPLDHSACERNEDTGRCKEETCEVDKQRLDGRIAHRWEFMEDLWDANKGENDEKSLSQRLNHHNIMVNQLEYLQRPSRRIIRIAYATSGEPTAAMIRDDKAILDAKLYQVACQSRGEAYYLLAIINSRTLGKMVEPFMSKGKFGRVRDLHKHLWKLPIPRFNRTNELHARIANLGRKAEKEAYNRIKEISKARVGDLTYKTARDELRNNWQRPMKPPARKRADKPKFSKTAAEIEARVGELLGVD